MSEFTMDRLRENLEALKMKNTLEILDTEMLVPAEHLLWEIDAAVDFNRLHEMVEPLYSEDTGRPSVDPVVLFKIVLIQHLYGLPSLRRTAESVAFDEVYDKVTAAFPETETIVADSAYKTPHICKKVFDDGRVLSTVYKRPQAMKGGHEWWKYVYDEYYNCVICPEYQVLEYSTTNRGGYREYKSDPKICANCPTGALCTHSKDCVKRYSAISGKAMKSLRMTPDIRLNTRSYTKNARKRLSGILRMQKKTTPCGIPSTEAWPR